MKITVRDKISRFIKIKKKSLIDGGGEWEN